MQRHLANWFIISHVFAMLCLTAVGCGEGEHVSEPPTRSEGHSWTFDEEAGPERSPIVVRFEYEVPGLMEANRAWRHSDEPLESIDEQREAMMAPIREPLREKLEPYCVYYLSFAKYSAIGTCVGTDVRATELMKFSEIKVTSSYRQADISIGAFSHTANDEYISFSFNDLVYPYATEFQNLSGRPLKIGLIEYSGCDSNGDPARVDPTVAAFFNATVHHLNPSTRPFTTWPHMHFIASILSHYNPPTSGYDIFPQSEIYVANLAPSTVSSSCNPSHFGELGDALDWFEANGVRLINRSTLQLVGQLGAPCQRPLWDDERLIDLHVRKYDAVVTTAAGQVEAPEALCSVMCDAHNQTCVGGARDLDHRNVNMSSNREDDVWAGKIDDTYFLYKDPCSDTYPCMGSEPAPLTQDREEPDVVAPAVNVVHSVPESDSVQFGTGTSASAPLVLGLLAGQLETITDAGGHPWEYCRVSEFMRAAVKFASYAHPVSVGGVPTATAAHDHQLSTNSSGLPLGSVCSMPSQCLAGTTCLWGRCAVDPGDEKVGWGMASAFAEIMNGEWTCPRPEDPSEGGRQHCGVSNTGACHPRIKPEDAVDPPGSPGPPPGKGSVGNRGYPVAEEELAANEVYRGVAVWSSCPVEPAHGAPFCKDDSECPQFSVCAPYAGHHTCHGFHENRRHIPAVDFDIAVRDPAGQWTWLSYSYDDTTEAFEYIAPTSGTYEFWVFPAIDDWDCRESEFINDGAFDHNGEFLYFIGRVLP